MSKKIASLLNIRQSSCLTLVLWTECLCLCKPAVEEALTPSVPVFGGGALGRRLGHEDGAPVLGLVPLLNRDTRETAVHHLRTHEEDSLLWAGKRALTRT